MMISLTWEWEQSGTTEPPYSSLNPQGERGGHLLLPHQGGRLGWGEEMVGFSYSLAIPRRAISCPASFKVRS